MKNNTPYAMLSANNIMDNFCLLLLIPAQISTKDFNYLQRQTILKLTSVGRETGILSEALDQAPAFRILMLTESER